MKEQDRLESQHNLQEVDQFGDTQIFIWGVYSVPWS